MCSLNCLCILKLYNAVWCMMVMLMPIKEWNKNNSRLDSLILVMEKKSIIQTVDPWFKVNLLWLQLLKYKIINKNEYNWRKKTLQQKKQDGLNDTWLEDQKTFEGCSTFSEKLINALCRICMSTFAPKCLIRH